MSCWYLSDLSVTILKLYTILTLYIKMKLSGLALANSISGISSFLILFFVIKKRLEPFDTKPIFVSFLRILAATFFMFTVCYRLSQTNIFLALILIIAVISYIFFCFLFRVREMREAWNWLTQRAK